MTRRASPRGRPRLRERAASRNYTLEKEGGAWYARVGETRFGPMPTLDEVDEFLPKQ